MCETTKELFSDKNIFTTGLSNVGTGELHSPTGPSVAYQILHGKNQVLAKKADTDWGIFHMNLFEQIKQINPSNDELEVIMNSIMMEDFHWNWFRKSFHYSNDEYEWFFMVAENKVQGICVIYHPKKSKLEDGDIFYVEYVAVAPWNRSNLITARKFQKIGTILLKQVCDFSINKLNLKPGLSLHSLPQSEPYYKAQGMTEVSTEAKDGMKYYEMTKETCEQWRTK